MFPVDAQLGLADGFARVELLDGRRGRVERQRRDGGLVGICGEVFALQAQRVLCPLVVVRQLHGHRVGGTLPAQAQIAQRAVCRALRPEAVHIQVGITCPQIKPGPQRRRHGHPALAQTKAAQIQRDLGLGLLDRGREQRNHTTRAVAVQHRERATQHLDALCAGQVKVRHLALAVGHGGGDAVSVQAQATHAKRRPRAKAAGADLQVLCVVVAVVDHQARHAGHHLGQIDHRPGITQCAGVNCGDGKRRLQHPQCPCRPGDHHVGHAVLRLRQHRRHRPGQAAGQCQWQWDGKTGDTFHGRLAANKHKGVAAGAGQGHSARNWTTVHQTVYGGGFQARVFPWRAANRINAPGVCYRPAQRQDEKP